MIINKKICLLSTLMAGCRAAQVHKEAEKPQHEERCLHCCGLAVTDWSRSSVAVWTKMFGAGPRARHRHRGAPPTLPSVGDVGEDNKSGHAASEVTIRPMLCSLFSFNCEISNINKIICSLYFHPVMGWDYLWDWKIYDKAFIDNFYYYMYREHQLLMFIRHYK